MLPSRALAHVTVCVVLVGRDEKARVLLEFVWCVSCLVSRSGFMNDRHDGGMRVCV